MSWPFRVTSPLLDVVQQLLSADHPMHGWEAAERSGQTTPNVYRALERLRIAEWVQYEWVENPDPGKPRRRVFWLTPKGRTQAVQLLAERRDGNGEARRFSSVVLPLMIFARLLAGGVR